MVPLTVCLFTQGSRFWISSDWIYRRRSWLQGARPGRADRHPIDSFGSAEVDDEVLEVAGDDEDVVGPASSATAEAKPNTIGLKVVSQYGTEGLLLPPRVPALVHTNAVAPAQWRPFSLSAGDRQ